MEIVQINFKNLNKRSITNFLALFLFLFYNFSLLDPDPGVKINVDPDPQPWWTVEYSMYNDRTR